MTLKVVNVSSTLTNSTICFVAVLCLIVDVRTDVRTDGHFYRVYEVISGDDLNTQTRQKQNWLLQITRRSWVGDCKIKKKSKQNATK